ncbi:hypothetical protein [Streptomyces sp. ODS05-4]|uniref:hypothetical protein n=1 Tax=Streptomyces sp. ODS05-4 TaxID=2944939 RepID=UPI00210C936E|nr:hypothetical protein [Streptomyces sp. ODS05-4]
MVITLLYCLERRLPAVESTAVTAVGWFDRAAILLTVGLTHLAGAMVGFDIARNVTLIIAIALVTRWAVNEASAAVAGLLILILNLLLGRTVGPNGEATYEWWALTLYPAESAVAWLLCTALFACALALPPSRRSKT